MALAPRFIQQTGVFRQRRGRLSRIGVRGRTGRPFTERAFEEAEIPILESELQEKQQQARTGLLFRGQQLEEERLVESTRRFEVTRSDQERQRKKKRESEQKRQRVSGAIKGAGAGFAAAGPIGGVIGGVIGAVTGGK